MLVDIVIGDWSKDGHNQSDKFTFDINCTVKEMQEAYKASCEKFGFQFHRADTYAGRNTNFTGVDNPICICHEYEDNIIPVEVIDILEKNGYDDEDVGYLRREDGHVDGPEHLVSILLWFIEQSREGFEAKSGEKIPVFNGYWTDNDMNIGIGYGMYWC